MKKPREILIYPNPILRKRAKEVGAIDAQILSLVEDMFLLMRAEEGAGLAAPQVGESLRIFVTEARNDAPARVFINPVLSGLGGELCAYDEGCLSLPEIRGDIRRQPKVVIDALDVKGNAFHIESDAFAARLWQHEFDHLEGILIIDRMTVLDRLRVRRMVKALEAEAKG